MYLKPSPLITAVMKAVCCMFGKKEDWATAKIFLSDVEAFKSELVNY